MNIEQKKELWKSLIFNNVYKLEELESLLAQGININMDYGWTLFHAIKKFDKKLIDFALLKGADINIENGYLLEQAIKSKNLECVKYIIEHNPLIDINRLSKSYKTTPLTIAANDNEYDIVEYLLQKDANIFADECKSIIYAAEKQYIDVVVLLLNHEDNMDKITQYIDDYSNLSNDYKMNGSEEMILELKKLINTLKLNSYLEKVLEEKSLTKRNKI